MNGLIYLGLFIMPLSALVFGALFFQKKIKWISIPLFISGGVFALGFDLYEFHQNFSIFLKQNQFSFVADVMGYLSILSPIHSILYGLLAASFFSLSKKRSQIKTVFSNVSYSVLLAIIISALAFSSFQIYFLNSISLQRSGYKKLLGPLNAVQIAEALNKNDLKAISLILVNSDCPEEILRKYSDHEDVQLRSALIQNKALPEDLVLKLSQDKDESLRFKSTAHPKITNERLEQLLKDNSKEVRERAKTELYYRKKS